MNRITSILIILICTLLLGGGALWFVYTKPIAITEYAPPSGREPLPQPIGSNVPTTTPMEQTPSTPPPPVPVDISTWQTYTNAKYNFQMKVPPGAVITEGTQSFQPKTIYFGSSIAIDGVVFWMNINDIDTFIDSPLHNKNIYGKLLTLNKDFDGYVPEVHEGFPYTFIEQKLKIDEVPALDVLAYGDAGRTVYVLAHNKIFTIFHYKTYITETYPPKKIAGIGPEFEEILRSFRFLK